MEAIMTMYNPSLLKPVSSVAQPSLPRDFFVAVTLPAGGSGRGAVPGRGGGGAVETGGGAAEEIRGGSATAGAGAIAGARAIRGTMIRAEQVGQPISIPP